MELIGNHQYWFNDGSASVPGLLDGSRRWLDATTNPKGSHRFNSESDGTFFRVNTRGADIMTIAFNSYWVNAQAWIGETVTVANLVVPLIGCPWPENDTDLLPDGFTTGSPSTVGNLSPNSMHHNMSAMPWHPRNTSRAYVNRNEVTMGFSSLAHVGDVVANGQKCFWAFDVGLRGVSSAHASPDSSPNTPITQLWRPFVSNVGFVGFKIGVQVTTGTAVGTDPTLKGSLRVMLWQKGIYDREFRRSLRGG